VAPWPLLLEVAGAAAAGAGAAAAAASEAWQGTAIARNGVGDCQHVSWLGRTRLRSATHLLLLRDGQLVELRVLLLLVVVVVGPSIAEDKNAAAADADADQISGGSGRIEIGSVLPNENVAN
jgi:hypothetical protein